MGERVWVKAGRKGIKCPGRGGDSTLSLHQPSILYTSQEPHSSTMKFFSIILAAAAASVAAAADCAGRRWT